MLRPWVHDLTWENPTDKVGSRYAIKDFLSKQFKVVVEAKYVRDKEHGKHITTNSTMTSRSIATIPSARR